MIEAGCSIRILHLEDDPIDAELTSALLEESEISCEIVRTDKREEYLALLSTGSFDLILSDYNLPGFDGMSALALARQHCPQIPFLFLSGALGEEVAVETLRRGATDYVLKNSTKRLIPAVERAIGEAQLRRRELESQIEAARARDEAMQANDAKSRFLSRMSHELRTPLNAILGYTQLMQADPMSEEQDHCSNQIIKAGQHLLKLINELLDIGRIESGHVQLHLQPVSVVEVIQRSVDLVRPIAREAGIEVNIDSGPCEIGILADDDRLTQVLINLLTNAVKYNRQAGSVHIECQQESADKVRLQVRDTGPGIPDDKLRRLFTPFDRLDAERNSTVPGTGLGLAVSRGLVEAMGGALGATSHPGQGATFWMDLPVADLGTRADRQPGKEEAGSVSAAHAGSIKVLLVEDNIVNADFMERVFNRRKRFALQVALHGASAIAGAATFQPDLVVMDINLPDMPGPDLFKRLRQDLGSHVPVIVVTADASAIQEQRFLEMGAAAYVMKPVNVADFFATIDRVLSGSTQQEAAV